MFRQVKRAVDVLRHPLPCQDLLAMVAESIVTSRAEAEKSAVRMNFGTHAHSPWSAVQGLIDAWYDNRDNGYALGILLVLFVVAWTSFHILANASIDLHADSVELYAWSRHPAAGYYKHPPLGAFVTAGWFAIFPAVDGSFYLLSMVNAAVGLYATYLIAQRYLAGEKQIFALLLLILTPFYQFHSERFGANQMLVSTWPLAS
jgi:hypothetical protein